MEERNLWTRRKFSKSILALQVLAVSGVLGIPIGCVSNEEKSSGSALTDSEQELLKSAMDEIIPASDNMPSASEAGGIEYIQDVFKDFPDLVSSFSAILNQLNGQSNSSQKEDFIKLDSEKRIAVLQEFEKDKADLFTVLKNFVYESYYVNDKVWKLIGYEPYPTSLPGPHMDPFDESLLDRMKKMKPFYTKVQNNG